MKPKTHVHAFLEIQLFQTAILYFTALYYFCSQQCR